MFKSILMAMVVVLVAGAGEVSSRVYTGPGGSYTPQAGEVVKELPNAKLQITRTDKTTFVVDLSEQKSEWAEQVVAQKQPTTYVSPVPVYQSTGQTFVYRNGQRVGSGSTVYVDPRDQIALRQQDLKEKESQHRSNMDWSRQFQTYQRDQKYQAEREANRQLQQQRDQQRVQENLRRDAIQTGQQFGRQVQSTRRDIGNRLEWYYRSQQK